MTARQFRQLIEEKGKVAAVAQVSRHGCDDEASADAYIFRYVMHLLDNDKYGAAAIVLWGVTIFNPEPIAVRKIWSGIRRAALLLLQGGGAVGKSYSAIVWLLLDWLRDPEFTNIKIISTTAGHAKANTYSTMAYLVENAIIKLPGVVLADYIGLDPKQRHSGISIVAIPEGSQGGGVLQGFHPIPRPKPHPKLGPVSRLRALLDEAEEIPRGVWDGVDNIKTSMSGVDTIKVIGAYNPKDPSTKTAQNAEPPGGMDAVDVETGVNGKDEWISKTGWMVVRIDPAKTENVYKRSVVYPGFQTYEGYLSLELAGGGNSAEYFTFGRGIYPPLSAVRVVIQSGILQRCRGEFIFVGKVTKCAGADIAVDGRDEAILTVGRFGMASGFVPADASKSTIMFPQAHMALQIDQQFQLKKGDVKIVGDDIKKNCIELGIAPEWYMGDATGNGAAVHSYLRAIWSDNVNGLDFGGAATAIKILEQDTTTPEEKYDGVVTEVWFALRAWMEFQYIAISPTVRADPLESELLSRRYKNVGKKMVNGIQRELTRVEKKDDQITRLGHSPDWADSLTIILHCVRMRAKFLGSMTDYRMPQIQRPIRHGAVDVAKWLTDAAT